ncbi:MAG TPA: LysR substrate-binding domain-containing protein [Xanthobacteraceae bacterium]|nr:LysR substrate-binding domain-containing protein [Xanthobacteraceae bacterium]
MELRHLRYFIAVAEELHFARAADKLNIAPPTLSAQIQQLETALGARLFTRKTRSVALTHVGRRFLEEARAALKQVDHAEQVGRRAAKGETGSIALGYILAAAHGGCVAATVRDFRKKHPDVSFQLRRMPTIPQFAALIDGSLDVGFTRQPDRFPAELTGFIVDRQPLCLVLPAGHRLAAQRMIQPADLAGEPFVATALEMEMGYWSNVGAIVPTNVSVQIAARVTDTSSVLFSVAAGVGLGVLPESLARMTVDGVIFRKLAGATRTSDQAVVFRRNEASPLVKAFIATLRAKARELRRPAAE